MVAGSDVLCTTSLRTVHSSIEGSTRFVLAKPLWKAWAPLKVKFTVWLAVHERLWTADRRHRHGLQDSPACSFCDQERETTDHLFHHCYFTQQVWFDVSRILRLIGLNALAQRGSTLVEWWLQVRRVVRQKRQRKGIDSTLLLVLEIVEGKE